MSSFICTFWGVGQGLFSSGVISRNNKDFIWVYDCGSDNQNLVDQAIERMKFHYKKEEINLLVISHFDKDHISGIKTLCQHYKIKRIVLPYYTLWDRLYFFFYIKNRQRR
ncbi:MBL fold metallo-hydrolase [Avibacterium avium]|uniref:MBL fold metallo-hydrolase n=1 Tax=Avibacterium avium TaxID=751 RepID=UPI003BF8C0DF